MTPEDDAGVSPVLRQVERRRLLTERTGLRHDLKAEIELHDFKQLAGCWQEVFAWFNEPAEEDTPMIHGRLVKTREKEWVLFAHGQFWAVKKSRWTMVGIGLAGTSSGETRW